MTGGHPSGCPRALSEYATILSQLRSFLISRSVPAFVVGGHVRDALMGVPSRDIDVAVQGDSLRLASELASYFGGTCAPLGREHRVARVVVPPSGAKAWMIDLSSMDGCVTDDLQRRDFTVDAMALPVEMWQSPGWQGSVIDPCGGRKDLEERTIRAVSTSVFKEDPVRLVRGVRLAAQLGFRVEPVTAGLIASHAHLLSSSPGERVRDEFLAILSMDGAKDHLGTLDGMGLLCCIIPELAAAKGVEQPKEHYWDVFWHSLHAVEGTERVTVKSDDDPISRPVPWDSEMEDRFAEQVADGHSRRTVLKLGALLHDVAKPQTKMLDADGRTRFFGHHTLGASMSRDILSRLRLSTRAADMVAGMVENHLRPTQMSQAGERPTLRAVYRYFRDVGDVAIDTLYLSLADHLAARGPDLDLAGWQGHVENVAHVLWQGTGDRSPERVPRLITGHDLMREFHMEPGPAVGALLDEVRDAQATGELDTAQGALDWVRCRLDASDTPSGHAHKGPGG